MINKEELFTTYQEAKNEQNQNSQKLREYGESVIDERLMTAAKDATASIAIEIVPLLNAYAHNRHYLHLSPETILDVAKALIMDYHKVVPIENIEDLAYIYDEPKRYGTYTFVLDQKLTEQRR